MTSSSYSQWYLQNSLPVEETYSEEKNLAYLLTYSMVQIPSWEANWFAASQEIPRISRNPKVHYRTHKHLPPFSTLGQPNPVHIPTSHLLEIHPNITHPFTPRSSQWFLPSGFPNKTLYTPLSSPIRATCPAHLILLASGLFCLQSKHPACECFLTNFFRGRGC